MTPQPTISARVPLMSPSCWTIWASGPPVSGVIPWAVLPRKPGAFITLVEPAFGAYLLSGLRQRIVTNDLEALAALITDREDFSDILPTV
ncbi:MAG: hypothetical protein EXR05_11420 [Acetobacteraceae bacterium]|nr:hypothetical protein [Acetobacteraceae bacterium]MSP29876.1 hypothetical protein [Acetobacteraceae bacterium]